MAEDVYAGNPLAGLADQMPGAGGVGLVLARAGVGKTALLVHVGLAALLRGEQVLHVALRDTVEHARAHCDEVLRAVVERARITDPMRVERGRMIHSFHGRPFEVAAVERNLEMLGQVAQFQPTVLLVDGLDGDQLDAVLPQLTSLAQRRGMRCWVSARVGSDEAVVEAPGALVIRLIAAGRSV